jgi:hypothetical protein
MKNVSTGYVCLLVLLLVTTAGWGQSSPVEPHQRGFLKLTASSQPQLRSSGDSAARTTKTHRFSSADFPGAPGSFAYDSADGTVVGFFEDNLNHLQPTAFTVKGNNYQQYTLNVGGIPTFFGTNEPGQLVGTLTDPAGEARSLLVSAGVPTTFDPTGSITSAAFTINDAGTIVGTFQDAVSDHGYVYAAGQFTTLDYPGARDTAASGIDSAGDIVGFWTDASLAVHGYLWQAGTYTELDAPGAKFTNPESINDKGTIAGLYSDANNVIHGFLYTTGVYQTIDVPRATATYLIRVKNNGTLVGAYTDASNELHGFTGH